MIRRILRRAVRYGYTFLGFKEPFLCRLVPQLISDMGEAYPELVAQQQLVTRVIREEEEAFLRTLDKGIRLMDNILAKSQDKKVIAGIDAFTLYDTYGFPIDLTELIAAENGFTVDMDGFNVELDKQKERARNATAVENGDWVEIHPFVSCEFTGYDTLTDEAQLMKYRLVKAKNKELIQLVFDRTPFYGEMGGEVGDTGVATAASGEVIKILNTVKENNLTIHIAERIPTDVRAVFTLKVDEVRRQKIANNHTCTHLLHQALREILGTHVEQKGSFVGDLYFRFDFSHFEKLNEDTIDTVERRVNALIRQNFPLCEKRSVSMTEARREGAMALFGEKYGDKVRVVRFGDSVELCGGCHTSATGTIGFFKITAESAVAAGIRRIEAVTGLEAEMVVDGMENALRAARAFFNNAPDLSGAIHKMISENDDYKKKMEEVMRERTALFKQDIISQAREINGRRVIALDACMNPIILRNAAQMLQNETQNLVIAAAYEVEGKPQLLLMYSADLVKAGKNAQADIKEAAKSIQGGGGGQPGLATAGGRNLAGLHDALDSLIAAATR